LERTPWHMLGGEGDVGGEGTIDPVSRKRSAVMTR
jgi:hypothetical protein